MLCDELGEQAGLRFCWAYRHRLAFFELLALELAQTS